MAGAGVVGILLAGGGCQRGEQAARASPGEKGKEPLPVRVVAAASERLPRTVIVTGTLAADEDVATGFKVGGRVSEIAVDLGSPVRKGQILGRLDPADFRFRVEQSEAALRQVRASLGLPSEGSEESMDPEKTALVREARAVLEEARLNRDRVAQLRERDLVARADFDTALSRLVVAEGRSPAAIEEVRNRQ